MSEKHRISNNASQRALGNDDNPPRRGSFPQRLLVNSQFDDPLRGKRPGLRDALVTGMYGAQEQENIPSDLDKNLDDAAEDEASERIDLRNFDRGAGRLSGSTSKVG